MASISLVRISKVEYADANLLTGAVPTTLTEVGDIKDGQFALDFPEAGSTPTYSEQTQSVIYVRKAPVLNTCKLQLLTETGASLAALTGNTLTTVAAAAGIQGSETLKIDGTPYSKNKYLVVTGENIEHQVVSVTCPNAFVTYSWTGTMGANQDPVGWAFTFNMLQDVDAEKGVCYIKTITAEAL